MNSICDGIGRARAKSVMKKTAPLFENLNQVRYRIQFNTHTYRTKYLDLTSRLSLRHHESEVRSVTNTRLQLRNGALHRNIS